MHLMKAFCRLDHGHHLILHILLCDLFIAKFAHFFLGLLLDLEIVSFGSLSFSWIHEVLHVITINFLLVLLLLVHVRRLEITHQR